MLVKYFFFQFIFAILQDTQQFYAYLFTGYTSTRLALYSLRDLTIGQRNFEGINIKFPRMIRVRIDKPVGRISKVPSIQNALLYQRSSRYSITLYSLSDLTIGLWIFEQNCYVRRIAMKNSALPQLTYHPPQSGGADPLPSLLVGGGKERVW